MDTRIVRAANAAQDALQERFWDTERGITRRCLPHDDGENLCYWWHAHTIDALLDAYLRTGEQKYMDRIDAEMNGVYRLNGNTWLNDYYDDMEWMALALLRVWDATGGDQYLRVVHTLWADIQSAWNDNMGGGMSWTKQHPFYKNTPANAPAAILAARLYRRFGKQAYLDWAERIFDYNTRVLVDPETGYVWDGINRLQDGKIDLDWAYTYCQGVYIGAALELYDATAQPTYLKAALRTALDAKARFSDAHGGVIPDEGDGDCGLFKGIFFRYIAQLLQSQPQCTALGDMMRSNAMALVQNGMDADGLIGNDWTRKPSAPISLCGQLSGIMLLEMCLQVGIERM